jgi:hypothetical protein
LRSQQIYHLDPVTNRYSGNRQTFYHSAVWALAPNICLWEAKADCVLDRRYRTDSTDSTEMVGRLIRALKSYDDLRFHLGALQTLDAYDDVADCVDRIRQGFGIDENAELPGALAQSKEITLVGTLLGLCTSRVVRIVHYTPGKCVAN